MAIRVINGVNELAVSIKEGIAKESSSFDDDW